MWCSQAICLLLLLGILAPTFGLPSRKLQIKDEDKGAIKVINKVPVVASSGWSEPSKSIFSKRPEGLGPPDLDTNCVRDEKYAGTSPPTSPNGSNILDAAENGNIDASELREFFKSGKTAYRVKNKPSVKRGCKSVCKTSTFDGGNVYERICWMKCE